MKYFTFIILAVTIGCTHVDKQVSYEKAVILKTEYVPDTRHTDVGYGMSSSGKMVMTITPSGEDEKFLILFRCFDHNAVFHIESERLFKMFKEQDTVTIAYYNVRNKKEQVVDYIFYDCTK